MFPHAGPAIHEEIRVGFQFREFDARMRFEGMPEVAAAVAHELHLGLVFPFAGDEFAPVVDKLEPFDEEVVRRRAVVGQQGSLLDPSPEGAEDHLPRRHAELLRMELAEAVARGVEGDFQIGVFGYPSPIGPAGADAVGPDGGEAHLVDPDVAGKLRFHRPFRAGVQTSVPPELRGFDIDARDFGDDPIRAVKRYEGQYLPYLLGRELRRRKRRVGSVRIVPMAFRAFVSADAVASPSVQHLLVYLEQITIFVVGEKHWNI